MLEHRIGNHQVEHVVAEIHVRGAHLQTDDLRDEIVEMQEVDIAEMGVAVIEAMAFDPEFFDCRLPERDLVRPVRVLVPAGYINAEALFRTVPDRKTEIEAAMGEVKSGADVEHRLTREATAPFVDAVGQHFIDEGGLAHVLSRVALVVEQRAFH
jgi:hypothetical protein